jgi:hypothetical protein
MNIGDTIKVKSLKTILENSNGFRFYSDLNYLTNHWKELDEYETIIDEGPNFVAGMIKTCGMKGVVIKIPRHDRAVVHFDNIEYLFTYLRKWIIEDNLDSNGNYLLFD